MDGRVVLDDLPWDAISRRHGSRDQDQCRRKWFQQLSPSMVARGAQSVLYRFPVSSEVLLRYL